MITQSRRLPGLGFAAMLMGGMMLGSEASAQVLVMDDFESGTLVNPVEWRVPFPGAGAFLGQTQLKTDNTTLAPIVGGAAQLELNTYNAADPGNSFSGSEMISKRNFAVGGGLVWKAKMRLGAGTPDGIVSAGFLFDVTRENPVGTPVRDEIDMELLSKESFNANRVLTNTWNDENFTTGAGASQFVNIPGTPGPVDLNAYHDYEIRWTPGQVQWSIDGTIVRTETGAEVPDDPMTARFNTWVPDSGFTDAYDASLLPAANAPGATYVMEVDSVSIERINTTEGPNLLNNGGFDDPSNPATDWTQFNNAFDSTVFVEEGLSSMITYGPFNFNGANAVTDASGAFQTVQGIAAGEEYSASVKVYSDSSDTIFDRDNYTEIVLAFKDVNGDVIEEQKSAIYDGRDGLLPLVQDAWNEYVVEGLAPAGTTQATVSLFFIQLNTTLGDFNGDFLVNGQDFLIWQRGESPNAGSPAGLAADLAEWQDNYGDPTTVFRNTGNGAIWFDSAELRQLNAVPPSVTAVPEPSSAVMVMLSALFLVGAKRRR